MAPVRDSRSRRPLRARLVLCMLVLSLGLGGCEEDFCEVSADDPSAALFRGLLCAGNKPAGQSSEPPAASFRIEPARVANGGTVRLDASASSDPDGEIVRYQWELDGKPDDLLFRDVGERFEFDAKDEPTVQRPIFRKGPFTYTDEVRLIGLRVTDDSGVGAETLREITIIGDPLPTAVSTTGTGAPAAARADLSSPSGARAASTRAVDGARRAAFSARLTRVSFPSDLGTPRRSGSMVVFRAVTARGRLIAPSRGRGPLRRFSRSAWVARLNLSANRRTGNARLRGRALATFRKGAGRACVRITMTTRGRRSPAGRLTLLGGTGAAARLRGGGRFTFRLRNSTPRLTGRIDARTGKARPLPRGCASLR